jgi:hypothetical protein
MYITINKEQINLSKLHNTYREYFYDIEILPGEIKFWGNYNFSLINEIKQKFDIKFMLNDFSSVEGSKVIEDRFGNSIKITFLLA